MVIIVRVRMTMKRIVTRRGVVGGLVGIGGALGAPMSMVEL